MIMIKNTKQGFTLLELLVVVLIIGILAAIALPQYQLAVDKSQFSNFQRQVSSIKSAFDEYRLIHNEYPNSFAGLDIDFSSNQHVQYLDREGCVIFKDSYCCVGRYVENNQNPHIVCGRNDYTFAYYMQYNRAVCVAANENNRAQRLCKNFNYTTYTTGNIATPYGHDTNNGKQYTFYYIK